MYDAAAPVPLRDRYGRIVTYLRVSVTDRCNLRCFYCLPRGHSGCDRADTLSLSEIAAVVRTAIGLGISKVRITGGEPLVRPGVVGLIRELRGVPGLTDLALSTNGTLLADYAADLKAAGVMRVNVSLDSLQPAVFHAISGRRDLDRVVAGITAARIAGLHPVKLNVVVMRDVNDRELPAMLDFASAHGAQARFIEYMPLGIGQRWEASYVPRAEILERIQSYLADGPPRRRPGDTASYYPLRAGGEVGVISPVSCRFCDLCNRLRLTADGRLRNCLFSGEEMDVRPLISRPAELRAAIAAAAATKSYDRYVEARANERAMSQIGG